jgi:hypothetical protein
MSVEQPDSLAHGALELACSFAQSRLIFFLEVVTPTLKRLKHRSPDLRHRRWRQQRTARQLLELLCDRDEEFDASPLVVPSAIQLSSRRACKAMPAIVMGELP